MADFNIEIPINANGGTSSGTSEGGGAMVKELQKMNKNTSMLNKTMYLTLDVIEMGSALLTDVFKLFQPLIKVLSLLFFMALLPLLPGIKILTKGIAKLAKWAPKFIQSIIDFWTPIVQFFIKGGMFIFKVLWGIGTMIGEFIDWALPYLTDVWNAFVQIWKDIGTYLWEVGIAFIQIWKDIGTYLWEVGAAFIQIWKNIGTWIWNAVLTGFEPVKNFGNWIWELFKKGLSSIANLGSRIWNFIKDALGSIGRMFGGGKASGGPVSAGTGYIVGERGPEFFSPSTSGTIIPNNKLGGNTININASVRDDGDVRKIANAVSKVLQRQMTGRFSS